MSKFDTMGYIICAVVLYYGIYLTVQNVRLFLANEKMRKEYLNKHKDGYTIVNQYPPYMIFFLSFPVIGIIGIFVIEKNIRGELYTYFALALMAITSADIVLNSIVKRWAIVNDDGFIYEKVHYCFRSILSMDPMKSIIRNIDVLTTERQHVVVFKEMDVYLHEYFLAWKKHKKNRNR